MIYNEKEFDEDFKKCSEEAMILSEGDAFSESYGMDFALLTDEHIKALQEGKALCVYINCGEYSCLLKKEVEDKRPTQKWGTVGDEDAEVYKNSRLPFDIMMYQILMCRDIVDKEKAFDKIMDKFKEVENIENQA